MNTPLSKPDALRKSARLSYDEAVKALSPEDTALLQEILKGDKDIQKTILKQTRVGQPLYDAYAHVMADFMDLRTCMSQVLSEEDRANQVLQASQQTSMGASAVPTSMPNVSGNAPVSSMPGLPSLPGLPGLPSLPGLPAVAGVSMHAAAAMPSAPPEDEPSKTLDEFRDDLRAWVAKYGATQNGMFEEYLIMDAIGSGNPELVGLLMDENVFRNDSEHRQKRDQVKSVYVKKEKVEYDVVPLSKALFCMQDNNLLSLLMTHPKAQAMLEAADMETRYHVVQFAFDTRNDELFYRLLLLKLDFEHLTEPTSQTPLLCDYMLRADAEDVARLNALVDAGVSLTATDTLGSNALMVATRNSNLQAIEWLLDKGIPLRAKNFIGETALSMAQEGPLKAAERQAEYEEAVERIKENYELRIAEWEIQAQQLEAVGRKPPKMPQPPKLRPPPSAYDPEVTAFIEQAWFSVDDALEEDTRSISARTTDDLGMDSFEFDSGI